MIIDAKNQVLGRVAAFAAKKALLGEQIEIVNCSEAVITGSKQNVLAKYKAKRDRGDPFHGPYFPKQPDLLVRRTIRGMLPHRQQKGLDAFRRIKCHKGVPQVFDGKQTEPVKGADVSKMPNLKFIKVGELCSLLGGKA